MNTAGSRNERFLARLAAPLKPTRPPYYVAAPTRPGELVGWYLELDGGRVALGSNPYFAQAQLEQLVHERARPTAA